MKILHILHQYLPEKIGGSELYTRTLARMQAASGHEVAIFTPSITKRDWPDPAIEDDVQIYRLPLGERSSTAVFASTFRQPDIQQNFQRLLSKIKPDIIHIQHLMGLPVSLIRQIVASSIPFVVTLHDYWYICANAQLITNYNNTICKGPNWWLNCAHCALARAGKPNLTFFQPTIAPLMAYRNFRLKDVLIQASQLIAPTHFVRDTYHQLGINPEKITVIPHGIQIPKNIPAATKQEPGLLRAVYIGGLAPQKGIHILVEAMNKLQEENIRLDIYGDPTAFPDYVANLQNQASNPNISFNGRLPHESLWQVLDESDVVIVPSLWYETASLITQEAFAAGVPVIASDIGALQERIQDGVDGLRFPPGNAAVLSAILKDLHRHPEKLAQLANGIQPVFTIDQHYKSIQKTYQLVLAQPSLV